MTFQCGCLSDFGKEISQKEKKKRERCVQARFWKNLFIPREVRKLNKKLKLKIGEFKNINSLSQADFIIWLNDICLFLKENKEKNFSFFRHIEGLQSVLKEINWLFFYENFWRKKIENIFLEKEYQKRGYSWKMASNRTEIFF